MPFAKATITPKIGEKVYVSPSSLCTISSVDLRDGVHWIKVEEQPDPEYNWDFLMERQPKWAEPHGSSPEGEGQNV
jgi:hypothetical protein